MTETRWYKRFHGTAYDPKFTAAGLEAQSTHCNALGVWDALLETTSDREEDRGSLANVDLRVVAAGLRLALDEVRRIWNAFVSLGMIAGERVAKWANRQGAAAANLAAKAVKPGTIRQRRLRARRAAAELEPELPGLSVTEGVTPVTPGVTEGVTSAADRETERDLIPPQRGGAHAQFNQSRTGRRTSAAGTSAAESMTTARPAHQLSMLLPIDGEIIDEPFYRYRRNRRRSPHQTHTDAAIAVGLRMERAQRLSRGETVDPYPGWGMATAGR
jgi:hypothetical protein